MTTIPATSIMGGSTLREQSGLNDTKADAMAGFTSGVELEPRTGLEDNVEADARIDKVGEGREKWAKSRGRGGSMTRPIHIAPIMRATQRWRLDSEG